MRNRHNRRRHEIRARRQRDRFYQCGRLGKEFTHETIVVVMTGTRRVMFRRARRGFFTIVMANMMMIARVVVRMPVEMGLRVEMNVRVEMTRMSMNMTMQRNPRRHHQKIGGGRDDRYRA